MGRLILPSYTVVRDTREQEGHGWYFKPHDPKHRPPRCEGMVIQQLVSGDYSALGYEDILTIERKEDVCELWGNYAERERFVEELERMLPLKYRYLLIESSLVPELMELSPPQFKTGVPGKSLIRWLTEITARFDVHMMFIGQCGHRMCRMIIEEVIRMEKDRWLST